MTFQIRSYQREDADELWQLFFNTVRSVNIRDYSPQQVQVWAPDHTDQELWRARITRNNPFICTHDERIVGFADLQANGHIDQFYVHCQWQGRGVGTRLLATIESAACTRRLAELTSHVSITARPFFESQGFIILAEQEVYVGSVAFTNFRMRKSLHLP